MKENTSKPLGDSRNQIGKMFSAARVRRGTVPRDANYHALPTGRDQREYRKNRRFRVAWEPMPDTIIISYKGGGPDRLHRPPIMATYNKDYSSKTAKQWLDERKWTGFLMRLPLNKEKVFTFKSANDIMSIRATASMLTKNTDCERKFSTVSNLDDKVMKIIATLKDETVNS